VLLTLPWLAALASASPLAPWTPSTSDQPYESQSQICDLAPFESSQARKNSKHSIADELLDVFFSDDETIRLVPCGINLAPEWALDDVGEPINDGPAYTYPDTIAPVRLYLIDTSVANTNGWIDANPKLILERIERVRGTNDFQGTYSTDHGTKLLSLIGATETGIAPGTPIHVVNYDIYPTAETTIALLIKAISNAVQDHKNSTNPMRSAICIATSSSTLADSDALQFEINKALAKGIPVVVSAGNQGVDASTRIPAKFGTTDGVICVGASDENNVAIQMSNFGTPVDLLAPGNSVRVRTSNPATPFGYMTGTSPATALVAGSVLTELSINGSLTPAEVENRIKACGILPPSGEIPKILRTTVAATAHIAIQDGVIISPANPQTLGCDPAMFELLFPGALLVDSDSNGIPDIIELFYGSFAQSGAPVSPTITAAPSSETKFKFPIAGDLFDEFNPFTLKNGTHWRIRSTTDFVNWSTPDGSLQKFVDSTGQIWLTATFASPGPSCFLRIELIEAATP